MARDCIISKKPITWNGKVIAEKVTRHDSSGGSEARLEWKKPITRNGGKVIGWKVSSVKAY